MSSSTKPPLVELERVGLRYATGPEILSDVTFRLGTGSFHFLTGPSGAGKTSLMNLLSLRYRPTRGIMKLDGRTISNKDVEDLARLRRKIGVVFQDFRLVPHLSVFENVALPLRLRGERDKSIQTDVRELLHWVGLGDHLDHLPHTLSGGQQQRVAIARAVINRPALLLADEPTGNLDDVIGERLLLLFEQLNRLGTTIIIATHSQHLLDRFPHARITLSQGKLVQEKSRIEAAA